MPKTVSPKIEVSLDVARKAFEAMRNARVDKSWGCARVYVQFSGGKLSKSAIANLTAAGFKTTLRPNQGTRMQVYVGYDNATGREYAMAVAAAKAFNEAGVSCYEDADDD